MSLELKWPYEGENFFSLANNLSHGHYMNVFSFILMLVFYISIIPMIFSGFSFYRKNHWGIVMAILYFLGLVTTLIVFQSIKHYLSVFAIILVIFNFILILGVLVLSIFRKKALNLTKDLEKEKKEIKISNTKIPLVVLILDLASVVIFLTTFIVPLYTLVESESTFNAIIINVLFFGETNINVVIYFIVNFSFFLCIFLYFANALSNYFFDKDRFIKKSKTLLTLTFITTLVFFLTGLAIEILYSSLWGVVVHTVSFIPMLLMLVVILTYAILIGKYNALNQLSSSGNRLRYLKIEPLFYVFLLTAITVLMLLLPIVKIDIVSGSYTYFINLTGIDILRDYASIDPGYRIVAYLLVVMLISVALALVVTLISYLSKYRQFNSIVKSAAMVNVFFVFIIAISGYYFQIAKEINRAIILDLIDFYGVNLPDLPSYDYYIRTDAIYALIGIVFVLVIMFLRKAFDRDELNLLEAGILPFGDTSNSNKGSLSSNLDEDTIGQFDPCYAFTELDSKVSLFSQDAEKRKALLISEATLNGLVHFVVEYASNSRLHLSYTPEDIATFVAGLGASRLSILQGMSGTGKTSLPKIFSEAIFGNCDIVEVESSWKDKNELLGYYNEFSLNYTPKKFTLALYKAALNQEIFTLILLDEMNLSRIEYYFSDFLSLMENEENQRELKLINIKLTRREDGKEVDYRALDYGNTLRIPPNVWFIGTANRDESTFVISDKVYDRAHTINFTKRAPKVRNFSNPIPQQYYDYQTMNNLFVNAKQNGNFDAENSELIKNVETLLAPYNISFGNRILNQIEDFVNIYKECFINEDVESEAIEKILLSKVVAKLEVKTIDDKEKLEMEFEKLHLHQCVEFIKRLDNE